MPAAPVPGADDRIIETGRRTTPARVLAVLVFACALAAVFGSAPLLAWANALPDGQVGRLLAAAALAWHNDMSAAGVTRLHESLRAFIRICEAFHF
jgi:hypothetical protein